MSQKMVVLIFTVMTNWNLTWFAYLQWSNIYVNHK